MYIAIVFSVVGLKNLNFPLDIKCLYKFVADKSTNGHTYNGFYVK